MGRRPHNAPQYKDLIDQMIFDYQQGMSRRKLSEKYEVSMPTVKGWLLKAGVDLRSGADQSRAWNKANPQGLKIDIEEHTLRYLYCVEGLSALQCANIWGVDQTTIAARVERFGIVRTPEQAMAAQDKINELRKNTCIDKYGGVSPNHDLAVAEKTALTNMERYGSPNPFGSEDIQKKIKEINLQNYGYENPMQNSEISLKVSEGTREAMRRSWSEEARVALSSPIALREYITATDNKSVPIIAAALKISEDAVRDAVTLFGLWSVIDKSYHESRWEKEVRGVIRSWGVDVKKATGLWQREGGKTSREEIDCYSSDLKIGVECNGSYIHSEARRSDANYHQKKTNSANDVGIRLYHLFEYEWENQRVRPIIESQLKNMFRVPGRNMINARSCEIVDVSPTDASKFLDEHHLQGRVGSSVRLGLKKEDKLVALMTFGKPSENNTKKNFEWELKRFAVCQDTIVRGGASRLFSRFVKEFQPEKIVSYSDTAKTTGNVYPVLGFHLSHRTASPDYVWWKKNSVKRRYQCSKGKLTREHPEIPGVESMTETQIMSYLGYKRINLCCQDVWHWNRPRTELA